MLIDEKLPFTKWRLFCCLIGLHVWDEFIDANGREFKTPEHVLLGPYYCVWCGATLH